MQLSRLEICVSRGLEKACALEALEDLIIRLFLSSFTSKGSDLNFGLLRAAAV